MRGLHLVRHGETAWNAEQRLQGRHDVPLSDVGRRQARALRATLAAVLGPAASGARIVSSPLLRARQTCEELGLTPDLVAPGWQEASLGEWTGRTRADLVGTGNGQYAAWRAGSYSPPGSEPLPDVRRRVEAALADLRDDDGRDDHRRHVVVVTHGGPIRAVCRLLLGLEPSQLVPVQPGSVTSFDLAPPVPRLEYFNLTPPLAHELSAEPSD